MKQLPGSASSNPTAPPFCYEEKNPAENKCSNTLFVYQSSWAQYHNTLGKSQAPSPYHVHSPDHNFTQGQLFLNKYLQPSTT